MMNQESNIEPQIADTNMAEDSFDSFLRRQLQQSQPYVMDDNFSAQVMAKLPARKKLSPLQERLIIALPVVIITLLILSQFSLLAIAINVWTWLVALNLGSLLKIGLATILLAISTASYWVAKQSRLI